MLGRSAKVTGSRTTRPPSAAKVCETIISSSQKCALAIPTTRWGSAVGRRFEPATHRKRRPSSIETDDRLAVLTERCQVPKIRSDARTPTAAASAALADRDKL